MIQSINNNERVELINENTWRLVKGSTKLIEQTVSTQIKFRDKREDISVTLRRK